MIEIIEVTFENLNDLVAVELASMPYEERTDGFDPSYKDLFELWNSRIFFNSHVAFLLKHEGKVKGMLGMCTPVYKGFINALYIAPDNFKQGFGRKLIEKAAQITLQNGGNCLYVEVQKHNFRALNFYNRLHFIKTQVKSTHLIELKKELI